MHTQAGAPLWSKGEATLLPSLLSFRGAEGAGSRTASCRLMISFSTLNSLMEFPVERRIRERHAWSMYVYRARYTAGWLAGSTLPLLDARALAPFFLLHRCTPTGKTYGLAVCSGENKRPRAHGEGRPASWDSSWRAQSETKRAVKGKQFCTCTDVGYTVPILAMQFVTWPSYTV